MYNNYTPYNFNNPYAYSFTPYYNQFAQHQVQPQAQSQQQSSAQQQSAMTTNTNKIFVAGLDDVKNRNLPFNSDVIFLDNDKPILYQKTVDSKGQFEVKAFEINEIKTQDSQKQPDTNLSNYVTLTEFEALKGQIDELKNKITKMSVQSELNALTSTAKTKEKSEVNNEQSSK